MANWGPESVHTWSTQCMNMYYNFTMTSTEQSTHICMCDTTLEILLRLKSSPKPRDQLVICTASWAAVIVLAMLASNVIYQEPM
jgi:hypothetical protein